jgi:hypothetical protein
MGSSGSSSAGGSAISTSSIGSSRGRRYRRSSTLGPIVKAPTAPDNSSSIINIKGYQHSLVHSSWPQEWMFLDTDVMAKVLLMLCPSQPWDDQLDMRKKLYYGLFTLSAINARGACTELSALLLYSKPYMACRLHSGEIVWVHLW